eukprot:gene274-359_t
MTHEHNSWVNKFYTIIMPKIYGIGAAIVIAGAMFKLLNWPGGALMLGLGLTTEAIIFFLSSFEPTHKEPDWTRVYPELRDDYTGLSPQRPLTASSSISEQLEDMFAKAQIDGALLARLSKGFEQLATSTQQVADLTHMVQATERYTVSLEKASHTLENMHVAHTHTFDAMQRLEGITEKAQHVHQNLHGFSETLQKATILYGTELDKINQKMEATNTLYTHIAGAMQQLQEASGETEKFRLEIEQLNDKLASLNTVYGNMLVALKS